jgi:S-DNA-T family DNA segregation ATPase FtsK/SpoIIIE
MTFQEGAVAAGVACHKIPRSTPGIGYALDEHGNFTRFRVGHVTDDTTRTVAQRFPAPRQIPVILPAEADQEPPAPRPRAPRTPPARPVPP